MFFLLLLVLVFFVLLEDQQKLSVGVFDRIIFIYIFTSNSLVFFQLVPYIFELFTLFLCLQDLLCKENKNRTSEILCNKFVKSKIKLQYCQPIVTLNDKPIFKLYISSFYISFLVLSNLVKALSIYDTFNLLCLQEKKVESTEKLNRRSGETA